MRRSTARLLAIMSTLAAASLGGCGFKQAGAGGTGTAGSSVGGRGGAAGGGTGGAVGGAGGGAAGTGGSTPVIYLDGGTADGNGSSSPDANCGARNKAAMKVAPDILILLDRSGSMNDDVNNGTCADGGFGAPSAGCGANSKWAQITPAITQVVSETDMDVNWGLKFFPDSSVNSCALGSAAAVDVGPGNGAAVMTAIMGATSANGGVVGYSSTPTRAGVEGATTYLSGLTDKARKFILLATDGLPTCSTAGTGGDDSTAAVSAVGAANTAGYPTFVVGIATGAGNANATLSNMADMGGLPRMGATPSYYPVTSAADLSAAIRTLIGVAASCTFQIGSAPTDDGSTSLAKIDVFGDGAPISRDTNHANGYDYTDASMQSIQVYGPLCDQIMSGAIHDVTVTFRCLVT